MGTAIFLVRGTLGLGGSLVALWELTRQASGSEWRKWRAIAGFAAVCASVALAG
jgi:hypothetical protein